jgi:hypothetical protein
MRTVRLKNKFARYYSARMRKAKTDVGINAVRNKLSTPFCPSQTQPKYDENYAL